MKIFLRIIDYLIIAFKIFLLILLIISYEKASAGRGKALTFVYLRPFLFYSLIGILRLWKFKNLPLLLFEMICNFYFIFTVSSAHAGLLILTIVSFLITLRLFYDVKITRKGGLFQA